jgi:RHS repeat-associated protein
MMLPVIAAALFFSPTSARAQSSNCAAGAVDYYADDGNEGMDIEQTACIYYDGQSGVDTSVETDNDSYGDWQDLNSLWIYGVGTEAAIFASYSDNIYDGTVGLSDSGMVDGATSDTGGDSVTLNNNPAWGYITYGLSGSWDECYQAPGGYDEYGCTWATSDGGPLSGQFVTLQVDAPPSQPPPTSFYSYTITPAAGTSGYARNGNLVSYTDSVMGTWSFGYDALNRLTSASASPAVQGNSSFAWSYDSFGNRLAQSSDGGMNIYTYVANDASGNPHNQVTSTNARGVALVVSPSQPSLYDAAGNMWTDGANLYLYDADGHVCAVQDLTYGGMTGYLYNASGQRVAKGKINSLSCDPSSNGFGTMTNPYTQYILGPHGEQMTEIAYSGGTSTWLHTNVVTGGVIATYRPDGVSPHFRFADWLGTTRVQTDNSGTLELTCQSLPFGDDPSMTQCTPATPAAEQFFTSYERDSESGNDYAQARHYANSMGRFLSPDPSGLSLADITNPQSLNLYAYVMNNPLISVDLTGLDGCQVDGVDTDCSALNSGAATACPANLCGVVSIGQYGVGSGIQLAQFYAGGGGAQGFVSYSDPTGSFNELNGQFLNDQQWAGYMDYWQQLVGVLANQQYQIDIPFIAKQLGVSKDRVQTDIHLHLKNGKPVVNGGHALLEADADIQPVLQAAFGDFSLFGHDFGYNGGQGSLFARLGLTPSLHLHDGYLHMDGWNGNIMFPLHAARDMWLNNINGGGSIPVIPY